jgi:hypothetical protein
VYAAEAAGIGEDRAMAVAAAVVVLALVAAACSAGDPQSGIETRERRLQEASQGLCDAQVAAFEGRFRDAKAVFDTETHGYLHELAAMLQDVDPEAAADLLEAKQRVEVSLNGGGDPLAMQGQLNQLQRALNDAAEAADLPRPLCREGAT